MKVLVTGGAGFIGSHIVDDLLAQGHEPVVLDDFSTGRTENVPPGVRVIECDILDPSLVDVFRYERPEVVSHHAGQTDARRSMEDPLFDARINTLGGLNVIRASVAAGVRKVIYASTAAVYGEPAALPVTESAPTRPISSYGVSKLAVEAYLQVAAHEDDLDFTVLRYANVYGPRQRGDGEAGVVAIFADRLRSGSGSGPSSGSGSGSDCGGTLFGDGLQTRDFVYVGECARANRMVLGDAGSKCVFNIGSGVETSIVELHKVLVSLLGVELTPERAEAKRGEIRHMRFDISHARSALGWTPEVALEDGLSATLRSTR